ncbi:unnamed protein product [Urochloa humidicola]
MQGYNQVDIVISYVLLVGAIFLELYAILLISVSSWTYADLRECEALRPAADMVFWLIKLFHPEKGPRWSNKISQYNLIGYCLKDKPGWYKRLMEQLEWKCNISVKTMWDSWRYTDKINVSKQLKRLVFEQIKTKASSTKDPRIYRKLGEHRGQWALQRKGLYHKLGWSIDCEFDESVLLWHIATDICFYKSGKQTVQNPSEVEDEECRCCNCTCFSKCLGCLSKCFGSDDDDVQGEKSDSMATTSREISNYMLFLLVMRPFMMTASIGQIRFRDTCAEAKDFFRRDDDVKDVKDYLFLLVKCLSQMAVAIRGFLFSCKFSTVAIWHFCFGCKYAEARKVIRRSMASANELMEVDTSIAHPRHVKGDRSKSVLFQACNLARELLTLEDDETRWSLITSVWVEMLCYASGKCSGNSHARQLSQGGELLTVVWFLMAHFGVGDQYRVESGHARAKLIVYN